MIRFAADENFDNRILRGVLRLQPDCDVIRIQDTALAGADDPTLLAWIAEEGRILSTHDVATMVGFAYDRVRSGLPMPGIFEIRDSVPIAQAIEELLLIIDASRPDEWENKVTYLPLR